MLTTTTQQRNSQGNLQGNPQSETPPISIETSPIAPIIDAAIIFSLRFIARIKRIGTILIMSALMVFLAACAGGGGGDGGNGGGGAQSVDTDNDDIGDNADNCPLVPNNGQDDFDNDMVGDACDVDTNGNGLIEIATAQQLDQSRYNLQGSSFKINATDAGDSTGCGGQDGITACNGYELTQNISLTSYTNWQPIGGCNTTTNCPNAFTGTFDGNGHIISNLIIISADDTNASGLFGAVRPNSLLHNIHIRNARLSGRSRHAGMLVGYAYGAIITNSSAIGNITGAADRVGGLVGYGGRATITSSYAESGNISGGNNVGGLVGDGIFSTITSSYAVGGDISGGNNVGGLVGYGERATITSSYAVGGDVRGVDSNGRIGGLVGYGLLSTITSSYAVGGDIIGAGNGVGGLIGYGQRANITSSYAVREGVKTIRPYGRVGGLIGDGDGAHITSSYAAGGNVAGHGDVGGLAGRAFQGFINSSYAGGGNITGTGDNVGGLVGDGRRASIASSYAAGGTVNGNNYVSGLVGLGAISGYFKTNIVASYWDGAVTIIPSTGNSYGSPKTTNELQTTRDTTGIYATWTGLCPGTSYPTWYFGDSTQYPILTCNRDSDGDGMLDIIDTDDDNDGTLDTADAFRLNPTEDTDTDNDGVGNNTDAFPSDPNESVDTDGDRVGDNADAFPTDGALSAFAVTELTAAADDGEVTLSWNNPNAQIASINISYKRTGSDDESMTKISSQITSGATNVKETITGLTNGQFYTFTVSLTLMDPDDGKKVEAQSISATATANPFAVTGLYGVAGDSYVTLSWTNPEAQIESISISYQVSGSGNSEDAPLITDSPKIDANETVQHNISGLETGESYDFTVSLRLSGPDAGKEGAPPSIRNILVNADYDGDGENNFVDVDADGDGLIEIATAQQLNQSRHNLLGSSFKSSAGGVGDDNGCGNGGSVTECNGYELIADIYLADYANWQPIGRCPSLGGGLCADLDEFFNAIFDGNNHTINNLTITNPAGSYANAAGLFGAISSTSILRNIHIRSGNLIGGGTNVGLLVGYARGASIINSSAEGAVTASGDNVGGLVGDGSGGATITSSYAAGGAVSGTGNEVGGLVGFGNSATITSSYAAGGAVSGNFGVGGLVGSGESATITSSYAADGAVSGAGSVGGLVGWGQSANITSSYAAGGDVSGTGNEVGGLVGFGNSATITSSYAVSGAVSGANFVGGLVGDGDTNTMTPNSYWDNSVNIMGTSDGGSYGLPQTTSALYAGANNIYVNWTNLCSGTSNRVWDFGSNSQYPAINCTPNGLPAQEHLRQR